MIDTYVDQRPITFLKSQLNIYYKYHLLKKSSNKIIKVPLKIVKNNLTHICNLLVNGHLEHIHCKNSKTSFSYNDICSNKIKEFEIYFVNKSSDLKIKLPDDIKTTEDYKFLGINASITPIKSNINHSGFHIINLQENIVISPIGTIHKILVKGLDIDFITIISTVKYNSNDWKSAVKGEKTRQIQVSTEWKTFSDLAEKALGHSIESADIIRKDSIAGNNYSCIGHLDKNTYNLNICNLIESDIIACHKINKPIGNTKSQDQLVQRRPQHRQRPNVIRRITLSQRVEGGIQCGQCTFINSDLNSRRCTICLNVLVLRQPTLQPP